MEQYLEIFSRIREIMKKYAPPFTIRLNTSRSFDLWIEKEVNVMGKTYPEFYFGGVIVHTGHVSLYMMSIYVDPSEKQKLGAELLKTLSGKSCFRIKKLDATLEKQIEEALKTAFGFYKKNKWC
jgi:hypothetical protein